MMYQEIQEERVFQTSLLVHELNKNYNSCPWHSWFTKNLNKVDEILSVITTRLKMTYDMCQYTLYRVNLGNYW